MFELEDEEKYNALPIAELKKNLQLFLANSKLDAVIEAIAQVAAESPAERGTKQLRCIEGQLLQLGKELK